MRHGDGVERAFEADVDAFGDFVKGGGAAQFLRQGIALFF